jgi:hypothetical protein
LLQIIFEPYDEAMDLRKNEFHQMQDEGLVLGKKTLYDLPGDDLPPLKKNKLSRNNFYDLGDDDD